MGFLSCFQFQGKTCFDSNRCKREVCFNKSSDLCKLPQIRKNKRTKTAVFFCKLSAQDELNVFLEAGDDGDGTAQLEEKRQRESWSNLASNQKMQEDLGLQPENEEGTQLL